MAFPTVFNVDTDITGSNGFKLTSTSRNFGYSVASAGDVNGDGIADLVIGTSTYPSTGAAYVIFGNRTAPFPGTVSGVLNVDSPALTGNNGFELTSTSYDFGFSVASAGDVNGDGIADLVVGTNGPGVAYVIFGNRTAPFPGTVNGVLNINSPGLTGSNGFELTSTSSGFGWSVASAGDLNGDMIGDLVVGTYASSPANVAYAIFGSRTAPFPGTVNGILNVNSPTLTGSNGFQLTSTSNGFGQSVASAGDVNGDGVADLVVGTECVNAGCTNAAYIVFGSRIVPFPGVNVVTGILNVNSPALTGSNGFKLTSTSSQFGHSVASAGDVNGDGVADLVVGTNINGPGAVYVIFGSKTAPFPRTVNGVLNINSPGLTDSNGFELTSTSSVFGYSVASAGDVNGDGIADLVVGASCYSGCTLANTTYVVFGSKITPFPGTISGVLNVDSPALMGSNGFELISMSKSFGYSVASAGDVNGDAITDLVVGAYGANAAYVVYGQSVTASSPAPMPMLFPAPVSTPVPVLSLSPQPASAPDSAPGPMPASCSAQSQQFGFPAIFNVDCALTGSNGFKLTSTSSFFGQSVASAGDVNSDGISDLVIGTNGAGAAYVVFGSKITPFPSVDVSTGILSVDSAELNGSNGFKLTSTSIWFGLSVASAGDVNSDGIGDLVIGAYLDNDAYVIFGNRIAPFPGTVSGILNVTSVALTGSNGFKITSTSSYFGYSVASAGDVNGDSIGDLVVGTEAGAAYVVFGSKTAPFSDVNVTSVVLNVDLPALTGSNGFELTSASSWFGTSAASAGDVNGDGIQDLVINTQISVGGAAYVVFGSRIAPFPSVDVSTGVLSVDQPGLTGSNGFKLTSTSNSFGWSVASAGDVNSDGISDLVVGASRVNTTYVIFGSRITPFPGTVSGVLSVDSSALNGSNGFKLTSTTLYFGWSVASAGDMNSDGVGDLVIGTLAAKTAYVVFGSRITPFPGVNVSTGVLNVDSDASTGSNWFKLTSTSSGFGYNVASAGDVNSDGIGDLVIGTYGANSAYVVFGQNVTTPSPAPSLMLLQSPQHVPTLQPASIPESHVLSSVPSPILLPSPQPAPSCINAAFPAVLNVNTNLTKSNGFKLTSTSGTFGQSVASAGDLNGDGIQDIIIGTSGGAAYVVFGSHNSFQTPFAVDSLLTGSNGFKLTSTTGSFGSSVASAGDFNGDGISDIVIGNSNNAAYVIFGSRNAYTNPFTVDSQLNGSNGFKLTSTSINFGYVVASAGDVNGDGTADIAIGTCCGGNAAYLVFGSRNPFPNPFAIDLMLKGNNGFKLTGISDFFGQSIASAGDFNGDGIGDIVMTAGCYISSCANAAYVVFGSRNSYTNPFAVDSQLNSTNGFKLTSTSEWFGVSVASAGDFNRDGIQDIVIGTANGPNTVYVIFGSHNAFQNPFAVDSLLTGSNGFKLTSTSSSFGWSVAGAGDVNMDGIQDIVIGTYYGADVAYVIFGSSNIFQNPFAVDSMLDCSNGFQLLSTSGSFGDPVANAGDVNGDSIQDIVIGAGNAAYVIYGQNSIASPITSQPILLPSPQLALTAQPTPMLIPALQPASNCISSAFPVALDVDSTLIVGNGLKLTSWGTGFGESVASAGDFNGDGITDVVIGAIYSYSAYIVFGSRTVYTNTFAVDSVLNGSNGFKLTSTVSAGNEFGWSVAGTGDFNGDGVSDVVIGNSNNAAYVIFGSRNAYSSPFAVDSQLNGSNGFKLTSTSNSFGYVVANAGDFNGDGISDITIGTCCGSNTVYVIFGSHNPFSSTFAVDVMLKGNNGFKLTSTGLGFGQSVAGAGDVNGDGIADIVIGAYDFATAYIIFGSRNPYATPFAVNSALNSSNGFKLTSTSSGYIAGIGSYFGWSVASAGDFNGDGISDIVVGARYANTAYVIFGSHNPFPSSFIVDSMLTGSNGFKLTSTANQFGISVASAGDVNEDGITDIIIGTGSADVAYVIFGSRSLFQNPFAVESMLDGSNGFQLLTTSNSFGNVVAGAGDFNGDQISDIIIGTTNFDNTAYIIYGKSCAALVPSPSPVVLLSPAPSLSHQQVPAPLPILVLQPSSSPATAPISSLSPMFVPTPTPIQMPSSSLIPVPALVPIPQLIPAQLSSPIPHSVSDVVPILQASPVPISIPLPQPIPILSVLEPKTSLSLAPISMLLPAPQTILPHPVTAPISVQQPILMTVHIFNITTGGVYAGTMGNDIFDVNTKSDVMLSGIGCMDKFIIHPHAGEHITITDFNNTCDTIDLSSFIQIRNFSDLTITQGSAIINLPAQQEVILQNLNPADVTSNNFIFTNMPQPILLPQETSLVLGLAVSVGISGCACI